MRILILNWRDIQNPRAGGAETYLDEIASRLVKEGHTLTWFSPHFSGAKETESVHGYTIIRRGNEHTVYGHALLYYWSHFRGKIDLIVDSMNGIPFFSFLYPAPKKVLVVYHIVNQIWYHEFPFPLAWALRRLEKIFLWLYRFSPVITISNSTQNELAQMGFSMIRLAIPGNSSKPLPRVPKKERGFFVFVGRFKKAKHPEHAVEAFAHVAGTYPYAKLAIIGRSSPAQRKELEALIRSKGLSSRVEVHSNLSDKARDEMVARAVAILVPSEREGWGLIVTEANAVGTPAIGYDVNGLRDSIRGNETGYLVHPLDPHAIAEKMRVFLDQPEQAQRMAGAALRDSHTYTWEKTARAFEHALREIHGK